MEFPGFSSNQTMNSGLPSKRARRDAFNAKRRMDSQMENQLFAEINTHLGSVLPNENVAALPKIKTLRLTKKYIEHLKLVSDGMQIVDRFGNVRELTIEDFRPVALEELDKQNQYNGARAEEEQRLHQEKLERQKREKEKRIQEREKKRAKKAQNEEILQTYRRGLADITNNTRPAPSPSMTSAKLQGLPSVNSLVPGQQTVTSSFTDYRSNPSGLYPPFSTHQQFPY